MPERTVRVFFYGSFINREVLAKNGFAAEGVEVARLTGFALHIDAHATLVKADCSCVYGIVCRATPSELGRLYGQDWLASKYSPEAVLVETEGERLLPVLCYIAPMPDHPARPSDGYLESITDSARDYGFPQWYIDHLESYRL